MLTGTKCTTNGKGIPHYEVSIRPKTIWSRSLIIYVFIIYVGMATTMFICFLSGFGRKDIKVKASVKYLECEYESTHI